MLLPVWLNVVSKQHYLMKVHIYDIQHLSSVKMPLHEQIVSVKNFFGVKKNLTPLIQLTSFKIAVSKHHLSTHKGKLSHFFPVLLMKIISIYAFPNASLVLSKS